MQLLPLFLVLLFKVVLFKFFMFGINTHFILSTASGALTLALFLLILSYVNIKYQAPTFFIFNLALSLFLLGVSIYFSYYQSIPTFQSLLLLNQVAGETKESIIALFEWKYLVLFVDFFLFSIIYQEVTCKRKKLRLFVIATIVLLLLFNIQIQHTGYNDIVKAQKMGLFNYEVYQFANYLTNKEQYQVDDIEHLKMELERIKQRKDTNHLFAKAKDFNVIVVQLEAFQKFPLQLAIDGHEITPNLNNLLKESIYFPYFYQQIGSGNTADAEFILNTSIYPVGENAMSKEMGTISVPSLPRLLKQEGYTSYTFHANDITFWNRNEMYQSLGFDQYFDKEFFGKEEVISYGASDRILYEKGMSELVKIAQKNERFYANFITVSSHHPYKIPEQLKKIKLPEKFNETFVGDYLTAINYDDFAIGELIQLLKESKLYDNTILVIFGDHFGLQLPTDKDQELIEEQLGREYSQSLDGYNVPLIIKVPGVEGEIEEIVSGQIDIMPTLANLLGISLKDQVYFGYDLLNTDTNLLGMRFYMPSGSFINDQIIYNSSDTFKAGVAKEIKSREDVAELAQYEDDFNKALKILKLSDQYVHYLKNKDKNKD